MAQNAVKEMDGATIQGQIIKCQLRNGKESEPKPSKFIFLKKVITNPSCTYVLCDIKTLLDIMKVRQSCREISI